MTENRTVWIINHYTTIPTRDGGFGRHLGLARHLSAYGWDPVLLMASTTHPGGLQKVHGLRPRQVSEEMGVRCVQLHVPPYAAHSSLRMVNMAAFTAALLLPSSLRGLPLPQAIVGCTVHFGAAWAASKMARRLGVPFVFEIRDIWPDTLVDLGAISGGGRIARSMTAISRELVSRADLVISPLPNAGAYLADLGFPETKFAWIPNGVEDEIASTQAKTPAEGMAKPFTFMYFGSEGWANDLASLLSAFNTVCEALPGQDLRLRVVGDGPKRPELVKLAGTLPFGHRITFEERIPRKEVLAAATGADCLVNSMAGLDVYRYGISLNKYYDYLLVGRPIVAAVPPGPNPISESGCGVAVKPGDQAELAEAMVRMAQRPSDVRRQMGERGRPYVLSRYRYSDLAKRLASALDSVTGVKEVA